MSASGGARAQALAADLRAAAAELIAVVAGVEPEQWTHVRMPGEWSPGKDAEHAVDAAALHFWQVCVALDVPQPDPPAIERAQLTALRSQAEIVAALRAFGERASQLVDGLTDAQLQLPAWPPRHPPRTVADIIARPLIRHLGTHREAIELKQRRAAASETRWHNAAER
jgi:hypothetical protein